eukprot:CAMPEP_0177634562 /NCGR_PEP_ID=MMETSP0447-20121125/3434_1 /TAXON_ID=0 /ORGANISM="Stygamoeba regulata, Strain BSH-02190019" /LENGTH=286 /DNA_ID=CAMNT_0019136291 /DNA_START=118 /DNA_END=978 /DNA_ORIENTATION=+
MGEVSQAEIVDICNSFLLNAPPGEFMEVVTDVRGLLKNDAIINDTAPNTFRKWNTDQMLQAPNGNHDALITAYNEVNFNEYVDPRGNCVVQFDHIRQEVTGTRPLAGELDSQIEPFRSAIDDAVANYCSEHYENGTSAAYSSRESDGSFNVTVCLSSSKFNPNNFWNGRWRSVYSVIFKPNGAANISGYLRINVHYYEDGNVQLVAEANKRAQANGGDPGRLAAEVAKVIAKIEQDYHNAIENSYATMGDTTFKALRRVLPITRQKIDWNKIKNYKIGNDAAANAR